MTAPTHHADGFHARIHPSEPQTTKGHKPGIKVGKDRIPEFHAETHPPGSAPPESTFQPDPNPQNTPSSLAANDPDTIDTTTFTYPAAATADQSTDYAGHNPPAAAAALDMPGSTSQDVYAGMGKPLQGMEGRELSSQLPGKKHAEEGRTHPHGRKRERAGLVGLAPSAGGGGGGGGKDPVREHGWDLPEGVEKGAKGKGTEGYPAAEDRVGEGAETVAKEAPGGMRDG